MSKADKLRKMQQEIDGLRQQLHEANVQLRLYRLRDAPQAGDFIKQPKGRRD